MDSCKEQLCLEYSEEQKCFHCNFLLEDGTYEKPLCTNGYFPVAFMDYSTWEQPWVEDYQQEAIKRKLSFVQIRTLFHNKLNALKEMGQGKTYTKKEVEDIISLHEKDNMSFRDIAELLGRAEKDVRVKYNRVKNNKIDKRTLERKMATSKNVDAMALEYPTTTEEAVNPKWVQTATKELTPREMIKKLYELGYRIEDNKLVCYVKQVVKINDIINEEK